MDGQGSRPDQRPPRRARPPQRPLQRRHRHPLRPRIHLHPPLLDTTGADAANCDNLENCELNDVGVSNSVWYQFTPQCDGNFDINTNGSSYDTVLSVWDGCRVMVGMFCIGTPTQIACDDDSGAGLNSLLANVPVEGGTTYYVKVADYNPADGGGDLDFSFDFDPEDRPSYDDCASPFPVIADEFNPGLLNTICASASAAEPQENCEIADVGVSDTIFFEYTPICTGTADINTNGSDYDTVLSVFRGTCAVPIQVACDDDSGTGLNSQLNNVTMLDGITYLIKVSDYDTSHGGGMLDFNFVFTGNDDVTHDRCSSPIVILSDSFNPAVINTECATIPFLGCQPLEDCEVGDVGVSNSVYYQFTPACNGTADINTIGSNYDTVLSVFDGCATGGFLNCVQPAEIDCDDDGGPGLTSLLNDVPLTGGTTYIIKVSDYDPTPGGGDLDFNFQFTGTAPPPNDACGSATVIPGNSFNPPILNTRCATVAGPPFFCEAEEDCANSTNTVWYRFTPGISGTADIDTIGSDYDTVLSVFDGCATLNVMLQCVQPAEIACDDDGGPGLTSLLNDVPLTGGTTYIIKVGDFGTTVGGGDLDFNFTFTPNPCPCDWNMDGALNSNDYFDFLMDFFAGNADFNMSGATDSNDYFAFLDCFFGACP